MKRREIRQFDVVSMTGHGGVFYSVRCILNNGFHTRYCLWADEAYVRRSEIHLAHMTFAGPHYEKATKEADDFPF